MLTDAQKKAYKKYNDKQEMVNFRVPRGEQELMKKHADKMGESLAGFIRRAVKETMERDDHR